MEPPLSHLSRRQRLLRITRVLAWAAPGLLYLAAIAHAPHTPGRDLWPVPDAEEYATLTLRLIHLQPPLIGVGLYDYPSRYSLAYPLLLAPVAALMGGDATRFYLGSALFGLLTVLLIAYTGRWLLGSRGAGALAAALFALHPQTVWASSFTMSENGMLFVFFLMLALARPWLDRDHPAGGAARAALLGLALAWLTLAKAPFAYWAVALAALAAADAARRRACGPLAALLATGGAVALADLLYRHWALGGWGRNGYEYWAPHVYGEFLKTFNVAYLTQPHDLLATRGNLAYYGRMLLGRSDEFCGRYTAGIAALCAAALCRPRRWGRRQFRRPAALLAGWGAIGVLFCGLYFYQDARFPYLWIPLLDLLVAWGLVRGPQWGRLRRGGWGRLQAHRAAQGAALLLALLLLRGEYRRVRDVIPRMPEFQRPCYADRIRPLLAGVPEGAWLFTNFKPLTVDLCRPLPGPTGALYVNPLDAIYPLLNTHAYMIDVYGLRPKSARPGMARELQHSPKAWENKPAQLIGLDGNWTLPWPERRDFFRHDFDQEPGKGKGFFALVVRPAAPSASTELFEGRILPLLRQSLQLDEIDRREDVTLYGITGRFPRTPEGL